MARKPNLLASQPNRSSLGARPREASVSERPWLKAYPQGVVWDADFHPRLMGDLLDEAVEAYGARSCTYFMGKRLSFAEIGELSDHEAEGLREIGVGEGVKVDADLAQALGGMVRELADHAAKGLREIGVGEGVKVGLLLPNTP